MLLLASRGVPAVRATTRRGAPAAVSASPWHCLPHASPRPPCPRRTVVATATAAAAAADDSDEAEEEDAIEGTATTAAKLPAVGRQLIVQRAYLALNAQGLIGQTLTKERLDAVILEVFGQLEDALVAGERVTLMGFGTLEQRHRNKRKGYNVVTGETMVIAASTTVAFRPAQALKDRINGRQPPPPPAPKPKPKPKPRPPPPRGVGGERAVVAATRVGNAAVKRK